MVRDVRAIKRPELITHLGDPRIFGPLFGNVVEVALTSLFGYRNLFEHKSLAWTVVCDESPEQIVDRLNEDPAPERISLYEVVKRISANAII